jgi:hypothetical protein
MHVDFTGRGKVFVNKKENRPNIPSEYFALSIAMPSALNHLSPIPYGQKQKKERDKN